MVTSIDPVKPIAETSISKIVPTVLAFELPTVNIDVVEPTAEKMLGVAVFSAVAVGCWITTLPALLTLSNLTRMFPPPRAVNDAWTLEPVLMFVLVWSVDPTSDHDEKWSLAAHAKLPTIVVV